MVKRKAAADRKFGSVKQPRNVKTRMNTGFMRVGHWRSGWDSNPRYVAVHLISSFLGYLEAGGIFRKLSEDIGTVQDAYAPTLVAYSERKRREKPDVARNSKFFPFQAQLGEKFGTLERKRRETMFSIHDLTKNHVSRNTLN